MVLSKAEQMGKFHYRPPEGVHRPSMLGLKIIFFAFHAKKIISLKTRVLFYILFYFKPSVYV